MGNCNSEPQVVPDRRRPQFPLYQEMVQDNGVPKKRREVPNPASSTPAPEAQSKFAKYLKDFSEKTYARMLHDVRTEPNIFVLNQLLLAFQYFDNFDKSKSEAQGFKEKIEKTINEQLAKIPTEGALGGERRAVLTHGMGEVLSRFYIYRPSRGDDDAIYAMTVLNEADHATSPLVSSQSKTFLCDSILPLDFTISIDNFEAHLESAFDEDAPENLYSTSAGEPPTYKCYMEEPSRKNKMPKGFVRLRTGHPRSNSRTIGDLSSDTYDYSHAADFYTRDKGSSHVSSVISEVDDEDYIEGASPSALAVRNAIAAKMAHLNERTYSSKPGSSSHLAQEAQSGFKKQTTRFATPAPLPQPPTPNKYPNSLTSSSSQGERLKVSSQAPTRRSDMEVKDLWQYKTKSLLPTHDKHHIPPDLLLTVEMEMFEDDEDIAKGNDETREFKELDIVIPEEGEEDGDSDSDNTIVKRAPSEVPKLEKTYLNSTIFSDLFCGDFHILGTRFGIKQADLSHAQVLGATVRCSVKYPLDSSSEDFRQLYTITPAIHSKNWPIKTRIRFVHRMLQQVHPGMEENADIEKREFAWLTGKQTSNLIELGCEILPLGFKSVQFMNTFQSLEWQVDFSRAETLLLETLKRVHWRLYIITAILFRACLAPLGPKGVNLEHVRHVIYNQCDEDYFRWYDEEPGRHLVRLLDQLYNCVAFRTLPNFFLPKFNMLKTATPQNALVIQFWLRKLQENILPYCIHSLRNLERRANADSFWPTIDLKQLFDLLTIDNLNFIQTILRNKSIPPELVSKETGDAADKSRKAKKSYKGISKAAGNDAANDSTAKTAKEDKYKEYRIQKYRRHLARMQKQEKEERLKKEREEKNAEPIPKQEKRKSIDLDKKVVKDYTNYRMAAIISLFIPHFLDMGEKGITLESYAEATMYALHVLNLLRLVKENNDIINPIVIDEQEREEYSKRAHDILRRLGNNKDQYITAKLRNPDAAATETFMSNFLSPRSKSRTLPPTPRSTTREPPQKTYRRAELSRIGESLKHIPMPTIGSRPADYNPAIHEEFELEAQDELISQNTVPPPPPPVIVPPPPPKKPQSILRKTPAQPKVQEPPPRPQPQPRRYSTTTEDYSSDSDSDDMRPAPVMRFKTMKTNSVFVLRSPSFFSNQTKKQ